MPVRPCRCECLSRRGLRLCMAARARSSPGGADYLVCFDEDEPLSKLLVHAPANTFYKKVCLFVNFNLLFFCDFGVRSFWSRPILRFRARERRTKPGSMLIWRAHKQNSRIRCPRTEFALPPPTNRVRALASHYFPKFRYLLRLSRA
jgi:hypothetical protein